MLKGKLLGNCMASNLTDYNNNKKTWIFLWKILLAKLATQSMASVKLLSKFPLAIFTYTARKGQWRYTRWHWTLSGTPSTTVVRCCSMNLQQLVSLIPPPSLILQNRSPSSPTLTTFSVLDRYMIAIQTPTLVGDRYGSRLTLM